MTKINIVGVCGQSGAGKSQVSDQLVEQHKFVDVALADPIKRFLKAVFQFDNKALWGASALRNAKVGGNLNTFWDAAEWRLGPCGRPWLAEVLHKSVHSTEVAAAYDRLLHWFFLLKKDHMDITPRIALQIFGTEYGRSALGEDVWIEYGLYVAKKLLKEDGDTEDYAYNKREGLIKLFHHHHIYPEDTTGVVVSDLRFVNEIEGLHKAGGILLKLVRPDTDEHALELGIKGHQSETDQSLVDNNIFDAMILNDGTIEELYEDLNTVIACLIK